MKTLSRLLLIAAFISLCAACQKSEVIQNDLNGSGATFKKVTPNSVTVPLKIEGICLYYFFEINKEVCGDWPWMHILASGSGTSTQLGRYSLAAEICGNQETNQFGVPVPAKITLTGANGDLLYIYCTGYTEPPDPNDPPNWVEKWDVPFYVSDGTGKFKGALGEGKYSGHNYMQGDSIMGNIYLDGTLTLIKGKP